MKIRHLLLGLMICVAGTGAIDLSGGFLDDQNTTRPTPFLIFGHVLYEGGVPCNSPNVSIANLDTGAAWYADTVPDSNFYQTLLRVVDVSAGDVLRWRATDGAVVNTTNHTVGQGDIDRGGIFDFNMILQSIAPRIIGYAPESQINDTGDATRRFNITINQVVDVTWLINSSPAQTNESVTDASYTHTNVAIGVWNVSARASNGNGTAMQEWIWNVTTLPPPNITSFTPPSPVRDTENATRTFGITIDQVVDVAWLINGIEVSDEADVNESSYTNTSATLGVWNVSAIVTNPNGTDIQEWIGYVNPPSPPPPSPIFAIYGEVFYENNMPVYAPCVVVTNLNTSREFVADNRSGENFYQIITDASEIRADDLLLINASKDGVLVGNGSVEHIVTLNESRSGAVRVDINQGWADLRVVEISTPPYIFDNVTNTINATIANNGTTGSEGFNVSLAVEGGVIGSAHIGSLGAGCAADVTFNWTPHRTGDHTLTVTADSDGEIDESNETNNATSRTVFVGVPDFTVLDVTTPDSDDFVIGGTVRIDASVANVGAMDHTAVVEFYDNGSLNITRTDDDWVGRGYFTYANDTITLPGALAIRVHFISTNFGSIDIYDKTGSKISSVPTNATDYWTDWILGDTVRMEEQFANFTIDGYQALIANETIHLNAGERRTVTASYKNATKEFHDLSVAIDPHDTVPEYDETNNSLVTSIYVDGIDLEMVYVDVPDDLFTDDVVDITATITNNGAVDADSFTVIFEDELGGNVTVFNETTVSSLCAGDSINITVQWDMTSMDTSIGNCTHNMTVSIPLDASPRSRYWPKDDINMENNIWIRYLNIMAKWDFSVETVTVTPSEAREGGLVDITAIIGNHGHASGNVSVGFYIDMWDNILGYDVVPLAYCDCLGAERDWSRDDVSNYTGRYIRIGTGDVWVDEGGTNTTSIRWDAFTAAGNHTIMVVADPEERLDEGNDTDIEMGVFGNNMKNCSLYITPPDLSITEFSLPGYADVRDMVNMTAVIRNNDDMQAKSTLWWIVEGDESVHVKDLRSNEVLIHPQQGVFLMRVHFADIYLRAYVANPAGTKPGTTSIDVLDMNGQSLYSSALVGLVGVANCSTRNISDIWTEWGSGDTLKVKTDIISERNGDLYGMVEYKIDKYQVVIGNETITLAASESYDAIWNATVLPGMYSAGVDVEDQNKSGTIILNGTELALTVSLNETYLDGDLVDIAAIITNLGTKNATDFTVSFSDSYDVEHTGCSRSTLDNTTYISGLAAGASVIIPMQWNANIRNIVCKDLCINGMYWSCTYGGWRKCDWTNEHIENYKITVEIDPLNNIEINKTNNYKQVDVRVNRSRDLSVTNISFAVNGEPRNPSQLVADELVTLNATIDVINLANRGGSVDVGFYCDDVLLDMTGVVFDTGNGTEYAVFEWLVDVGGNHTITVKVDPVYPRDKIVEFNESNNILHQGVHIIAPDFVVESIALDPEISEVGDVVNIAAMVANIGQKNASNVTVRFIDECRENASLITDRTISLNISENRSISVDWNTSMAGPHNISVIIDPENDIPELDESNNELTKSILVQGADLTVSNLTLTSGGGTVTRTIEHGDVVNITAEIANVGVRDAHNISVGFFINDSQINKTNINLIKGGSINISTLWNTTSRDCIGNLTVRVFVDCDYTISETNETNNTLTKDVYVCTPELSGNISWDPPNPLDEDEVTINTTITNLGCVPTEDFTVLMFYDYLGEEVYSKTHLLAGSSPDEHRSYNGAEWVYVRITGTSNIKQGDLIVYDRNNAKIASPVEPCWIAVPGDAATVKGTCSYWQKRVTIRFYAVYPEDRLEVKGLDAGSATNFSLVKKVSSLNHTIAVFIDPENNVPENNETDNTPSEVMYVTPTRDFTVTNVTTAETTNLTDTDAIMITATVANIGFKNGTTTVSFVDREEESLPYPYWFDKRIAGEIHGQYRPPYAPVDPPSRSTVIHRPGADAIVIDDFRYETWDDKSQPIGEIWVCDETGEMVWYYVNPEWGFGGIIPRVEGDTATIYATGASWYALHGYTTIDEFNRTEVTLNATETWNESKTLTSIWTASTGDHIITVVADPDDETGEIDESNNNRSIPLIHVNPSRDLAIINLTNTPLKPSDGDDVTITAEVRNNGYKTANFAVDFWEDTTRRYKTDSQHISVPGASFVDIHLDYRWNRKMMPVGFEWTRVNDTWLGGSLGDTIEVRSPIYWELYVCGVRMYFGPAGDYVWREHVDRIRYMKLLNRTYVTLAPNETRNVTVIWEEMSIKDDPEYSVIVIVDPEDEIDEIDESNNKMERQISMECPDLEIGNFESPTETRGARVTIKNTGMGGADDINVTLEMAMREDCSLTGTRGYYTVRHNKAAYSGMEAAHIRVHFDYINIPDSGGNLKIAKSISSLRRGDVTETYREDVGNVWCPWVEGDKLLIDSFNAKSFKVDEYEWGDVDEEVIDHLGAYSSKPLEIEMLEDWKYTEPTNLTARVDPDGKIPEMDDKNNNKTVIVYADLVADRIEFVSPMEDKLCLDAEKFVIDGYITNGGGYKGDIVYPVSDFNVTLEFRERYPNGTISEVVFNTTKRVDEPFYSGQEPIRFEFDPAEEFEVGGNYSVYLIADSSGDICESNDIYPKKKDKYQLGEYNNITSEDIYIYNTSGYSGGGELINVAQGEVNGRVVYTVGDIVGDYRYGGMVAEGATVTVRYPDTIPDNVNSDNIEFARLFVYWYTWVDRPVVAGVDATFNGHSLAKAGNYSDNPGAAEHDCGYGLYSYDVTDYVINGENGATMTTTSEWCVGVQAISLLVVYEDDDAPLTKYWINEGADIQLAKNRGGIDGAFDTCLPYSECIAYACFKDVESDDLEGVNATLMTILGMNTEEPLYPDAGGEGDRLWFNDPQIGTPLAGTNRHYWEHLDDSAISVTRNRWEDVTDHLKRGDNEATMGSRGNFIMPNNAFLRLIFPPDLNVINLTAPASTVVGAHHSINTTIRNDGRSDAHDFNVTFHIDGKQMVRIPHLDLAAGENMTIHLYNWTPMMLMHVYNLTAAVDVLSGEDWTEIETDNNAMTKRVIIEEGGFGNQTGPRGPKGGSNPTGGEYTEEITGRVMQGLKEFFTMGGGGGAGMFSLTEWIMKGAVWLVLLLFVCAGYRMEQRSYGRVRPGYAGGVVF